jgi:hypothetical protein
MFVDILCMVVLWWPAVPLRTGLEAELEDETIHLPLLLNFLTFLTSFFLYDPGLMLKSWIPLLVLP